MRMRGMPSICNIAQRVCGACDANIRICRIVSRNASEKVEAAFDISMTRSVVGLSKGDAIRFAVRINDSIFMRRTSRL